MTETKLFVSSCSRREMTRRRHARHAERGLWLSSPLMTGLLFVLVCAGAFVAGRGGI